MRRHYFQYICNEEGQPLSGVEVYVVRKGYNLDSTPTSAGDASYVNIFTSLTATIPINSYQGSTDVITTDTNGYYEFWIADDNETYGYSYDTNFKIGWYKSGILEKYIDDVDIFPSVPQVSTTDYNDTIKDKAVSDNLVANTWVMASRGFYKRARFKYVDDTDIDIDPGIYNVSRSSLASTSLGYWPMNETTGTNVTDGSSAPLNHGTLEGTTSDANWVTGRSGNAVSMDGLTNWIDCGNSSPLDTIGTSIPWSISCWVKIDADDNGTNYIFGKYVDYLNFITLAVIRTSGSYQFKFQVRTRPGGTTYDIYMGWVEKELDDGVWHHIALTIDMASLTSSVPTAVKLYIDNVLTVMDSITFDHSARTDFSNSADIIWGGYNKATNTSNLNGELDECYIFDHVLTPLEVGDLYQLSDHDNFNVYWDSTLTFVTGTGGSNPDSEDLATSGWNYIYLDYDKITALGTNKIDETCFINTTEVPEWNVTKRGWYPASNGDYVTVNDRCVFAVYSDATNDLEEWIYNGSNFIKNNYSSLLAANKTTSWTDVTFSTAPTICDVIQVVSFNFESAGNATSMYWRKNGSTADGIKFSSINDNKKQEVSNIDVFIDSDNKIEVKAGPNAASDHYMSYVGFYLPKGM